MLNLKNSLALMIQHFVLFVSRCKENCLEKKALSSGIEYTVVCHSKCSSLYWKILYTWQIHVYDNDTWNLVRNLSEISFANTSVIKIMKGGLTPGKYHNIVAEGSVGGFGDVEFVNETFLMNKLPFGGKCGCEPRSGIASVTEFEISCLGWKEFEKPKNAPGLKYEYRARPKGKRQSFLLYFSFNENAVHLMLPVGDAEKLMTETVINVIDSLGDKYEFVFEVKVTPPPLPEKKILEATYNLVSDDKMEERLKANNFSEVASSVYSVTSILNAHLNESFEDDKNLTTSEKLESECSKRKQRIAVYYFLFVCTSVIVVSQKFSL